jgi:hypothetical protein
MFHSNKVTLKEYVIDKFAELEKSKNIALFAMDKRLDSMNEIKGAMKDQQAYFITRTEFEAKIDTLGNKIEIIQKLLYIGVGAVLVLQIIFRFFAK